MDDRGAPSSPEETKWKAMAEGLDAYREFLRMYIAATEAEGFTPREARALVTALLVGTKSDEQEEDPDGA